MAANRRVPDLGRKTGMWATITAAVEAGWGATSRLLTVLVILGALVIGITYAAGDNVIVVMLRTLLVGSR